MSRYYTDFSEYTADVFPADWTLQYTGSEYYFYPKTKSGATGGKVLEGKWGNAFEDFLSCSWDDLDADSNRANAEVFMRVRSDHIATLQACAIVRGSRSSTFVSGYTAGLFDGTHLKVFRMNSGTPIEIGSYSFTWIANAWYKIRFRVNGTSIKARVWADADSEPTSWHVDTSDSNISAAGFIGVHGYDEQAFPAKKDFDVFGVGIDGDIAPHIPLLAVNTGAASNIVFNAATLAGDVTEYGGDNPTRYIEYGTTNSYGSTASAGIGGEGAYEVNISGLNYNTLYHYRAKAVNSTDTRYGADSTFTTDERPNSKPLTLIPQGTGVWPADSHTFSWTLDDLAIQTDYELKYRTGGGSWVSTGTITSATLHHNFVADTFGSDTVYEWQVRSWDSEHSSYYDWSDIVQFSTICPPIVTELTPADESDINLGIVDVSAKVVSRYGRLSKLTLLVADNADLENAITYNSLFVATGETITFNVGFGNRGRNYLQLTAEDSEGLQTIIDFQLSVLQTLYFIDEPSIQTQGPQATHVTVRIKNSSPVVEYTSHTTPEVNADKKVERLVEIDSGDASVCQTVSEQLVARWGREQVSISGDINLVVSLSFKEKVRVVDAQTGIDGDYVLQEKEHDINNMKTNVKLGDIILNDSELLARILDKLKK